LAKWTDFIQKQRFLAIMPQPIDLLEALR
jgi:hypothetical protein